MKLLVGIALVVLMVPLSGCQTRTEPRANGSDGSPTALTDAAQSGVARDDCRSTSSASVRGMTGSFPSADEAARSVRELPADGALVQLEAGEDAAAFGWVSGAELLYVIDTHRSAEGWTVGSYEMCQRSTDEPYATGTPTTTAA